MRVGRVKDKNDRKSKEREREREKSCPALVYGSNRGSAGFEMQRGCTEDVRPQFWVHVSRVSQLEKRPHFSEVTFLISCHAKKTQPWKVYSLASDYTR